MMVIGTTAIGIFFWCIEPTVRIRVDYGQLGTLDLKPPEDILEREQEIKRSN
jgi:hypothetical protein